MIWRGLYFANAGYAEVARRYTLSLDDLGAEVVAQPTDGPMGGHRLEEAELDRIRALAERTPRANDLRVQHVCPPAFAPGEGAVANVGYTVFETDRVPVEWVGQCNAMDEIWVPSTFCVQSFARTGVYESKLHVIPHGVDVDRFGPHVDPMEIEGAAGFVFLSVFYWCKRKGWDVLLRAYCSEFAADEDVCLTIRSPELDHGELTAFLSKEFSTTSRPPILLLPFALPNEVLPALYAAADAFVVPARGEGWGLTYGEAMASGLPTIATNWGGHLDFMNEDRAYLVEVETLVPIDSWMRHVTGAEADHVWAEPSVDHLRQVMRHVFEHREEAAAKGRAARDYMARKVTWRHAAIEILERVEALGGTRL